MMTDLEKVVYLNKHIGEKVHFYHHVRGDSTAQILSVNSEQRNFSCIMKGSTAALVSIDEVTEFDFRENNVTASLR